jgi:hypothetical protein
MSDDDVKNRTKSLMDAVGPHAAVALRAMMLDPKLSARDRLAAIGMVLDRVYPIPKIDSAASARTKNTFNLISSQNDIALITERMNARQLASKPLELLAEPVEPSADPK